MGGEKKAPHKRVLVIANLIHASPRLPGLLSPLARHGWDVTIITPPLPQNYEKVLGFPDAFKDQIRICEVAYPGDIFTWLRAIMGRAGYDGSSSLTEQLKGDSGISWRGKLVDMLMMIYQLFMAYPDTERTWIRYALGYTKQLLKTETFDVLLSSSPMASSHVIAKQLFTRDAKKLGSWIADFRDTWTQNPAYPFPWFRRVIERRYESATLSGASKIITVSDTYADNLRILHRSPVHVIPNGYSFEPDEAPFIAPLPVFTMTYTCTIYPKFQDTTKILDALLQLKTEQKLIDGFQLRFYGRYDSKLAAEIRKRDLESEVVQLGYLSRIDAVHAQRESQMLLFLRWEHKEQKGLSHLKLYEYLSSNRPIFATGGHAGDEASQIINETSAGYCCETIESIKQQLSRSFETFTKKGVITSNASISQVRQYSYAKRSQQLAQLVHGGRA